jgi:pyruvate/2-oxoglutarate dehydrogenase complex dihydrolipoamide dehydrogenase (E3) component
VVTIDVDVIVVGLGPGGEEVAGRLAEAGLSTIGIEAELLGGECPYWGCIPSKMMVRAADVLAEGRRIGDFAGSSTVSPSWAPVAQRIRKEATDSWDDRVAVERFEGKGGRFVRGRARVVGPGVVEVEGEQYRAGRALVLSTGARAWVPPMFEAVPHWTNREAIAAETLPSSLLVVGGGAIGLEIGQAMARFGVQVTVVEMGPRLAGPEEPEASALLTEILAREGIAAHCAVTIESVTADSMGAVTLQLQDGPALTAERVLVATGRRVDLAGLGVGALGLDESARALPVDGMLRVEGVERTWGVGDVTGKGAFTHVAMYQARICVASILGRPIAEADYRALPRVTFTDPEIGSVGMTEAQAREEGGTVSVMSESIASSTRGWIHKGEGIVKLVALDGVVVGATSMGPSGGEVLGLLALAVHARVPVATLKEMIYAYPTFTRAIDSALWSEG